MVAKISVRAWETRWAPACWPERVVLAALALFVGVGGMFGGVQMLADPVHPMGMSPQIIAGSPYDSYTQPALLLLLLLGVIPVLVAVGLLVRYRGPSPARVPWRRTRGMDRRSVGPALGPTVAAAGDLHDRRGDARAGPAGVPPRSAMRTTRCADATLVDMH
jgi:hypothetical protein